MRRDGSWYTTEYAEMEPLVVVFVVLWSVAALEPADYSQARIVKVKNVTVEALEELMLMEDSGDFETISASTDSIDILLLNKSSVLVEEEFANMNITYETLVEDVQEMIDKEQKIGVVANDTKDCEKGSCITWDKYYRLDIIYKYLEYLQRAYPARLTVETIGHTAEHRPLRLVKITASNNKTSTKAIWVDGDVVRLHHPAATDTEIAVLIKYWLFHAKERKDRLMKKAAEEAEE